MKGTAFPPRGRDSAARAGLGDWTARGEEAGSEPLSHCAERDALGGSLAVCAGNENKGAGDSRVGIVQAESLGSAGAEDLRGGYFRPPWLVLWSNKKARRQHNKGSHHRGVLCRPQDPTIALWSP